jgi:hypothetical protein
MVEDGNTICKTPTKYQKEHYLNTEEDSGVTIQFHCRFSNERGQNRSFTPWILEPSQLSIPPRGQCQYHSDVDSTTWTMSIPRRGQCQDNSNVDCTTWTMSIPRSGKCQYHNNVDTTTWTTSIHDVDNVIAKTGSVWLRLETLPSRGWRSRGPAEPQCSAVRMMNIWKILHLTLRYGWWGSHFSMPEPEKFHC